MPYNMSRSGQWISTKKRKLYARRSLRMTVAFGGRAAGRGIRRKTTSETLAIRLTLDVCDLGRE